jgi:hypothetical protein
MVGVVEVGANIIHIGTVKEVDKFVFNRGATGIVMSVEITQYDSM